MVEDIVEVIVVVVAIGEVEEDTVEVVVVEVAVTEEDTLTIFEGILIG
jgi:hypothetical protein